MWKWVGGGRGVRHGGQASWRDRPGGQGWPGDGTGRLKWFRCLSCASESCVVSLGLLVVCDGGHVSLHGREAVAQAAGIVEGSFDASLLPVLPAGPECVFKVSLLQVPNLQSDESKRVVRGSL